MKKFLASFGFGWSKWETIEKDKILVGAIEHPVTRQMSEIITKRFDIQQRKNSITGKIQKRKIQAI